MAKPSILVVEDEQNIFEILRLYLEREGYAVIWAADGAAALDLFFGPETPDLVLLDLLLPRLDGWEVCRRIRQVSNVPILMLTARDLERDKVLGLEMGADDYITKPFSPREVVARIKAALRRAPGALGPAQAVVAGSLHIDVARHLVSCHGEPVSLSPTEFKLLAILAQHPGQVLSRAQLLERLEGPDAEVFERTVDAHVKNLRRKLVAVAGEGQCRIETVPGFGYRFAMPGDASGGG